MIETTTQDDDPVAAYKKKYGGAPPTSADSADPVAQYRARYGNAGPQDTTLNLNTAMTPSGHDFHAEYRSGALANRMEAENEAEKPASNWQQALGGVAALGHRIPAVEAAQAGLRSIYRTAGNKLGLPVEAESYPEAYQNIRKAEGSTPTLHTPWYLPDVSTAGVNSVIGGTVAGAAMPNRVPQAAENIPVIGKSVAGKLISPAKQAAIYGAAEGAAQANPDAGIGTRAKDTAIGAVTGAVTGKAADAATNLARSAITPTLGNQALSRKAAMSAADRLNYGAAESEAAAGGGSSPAVRDALNHPQVKPLADDIRASFSMQGKPTDDASVLMQVHRELSQNERALIDRAANAPTARPLTAREQGDVHAVKQMLRRAAASPSTKPPLTLDVAPDGPAFQLRGTSDVVKPGVTVSTPGMRIQTAPAENVPPLMPSFPRAVAEHARMQGETSAFENGADATQRLLGQTSVAGKKLTKKSAEAFGADVSKMTPGEAEAALNGVLGRTKEFTTGTKNPLKMVNPWSWTSGKVTPFVQQLEQQMGGAPIPIDILRYITASQGHPSP